MEEVVLGIFMMFGSIGVLLIGMKMMSDGLERSSGRGMRKLFGKISNNRFLGLGVGTAVTALIQSSSATTVMVIGFVNAGLMTLLQAAAIIMGANIGTTITGLIASLSAFDFATFLMLLAFVGALISMLAKEDKFKRIGGIMAGLGLIFVALNTMSSAFKIDEINTAMVTVFEKINFPLLLILIGMAFTALIQSSSAVTSIIITMVGTGAMPMQSAIFIVLGTNIGTCVTAAIAAIGASTNAKRAAVIHLLFNVIGTFVFTALIWPLQNQVVWLLDKIGGAPQFQVALFHLFFNIITTALLLPFIKQLTKLATLIVHDKKDNEEDMRLYYVDDRFLQTPPIAVAQLTHEINHMGVMVRANLKRGFNAIMNDDLSDKAVLYRDENKINFINKGSTQFLVKLSALPLSKADEKYVGSLYHVVSDFERIGDHAENFMEEAESMHNALRSFTSEAKEDLQGMFNKVMEMYDLVCEVFLSRDATKLSKVSALEDEVDAFKKLLSFEHIVRLNQGICNVETGADFNVIISALERIGDHLTNIAFSIKSPSGSQRDAMEKIAKEQNRRSRTDKGSMPFIDKMISGNISGGVTGEGIINTVRADIDAQPTLTDTQPSSNKTAAVGTNASANSKSATSGNVSRNAEDVTSGANTKNTADDKSNGASGTSATRDNAASKTNNSANAIDDNTSGASGTSGNANVANDLKSSELSIEESELPQSKDNSTAKEGTPMRNKRR